MIDSLYKPFRHWGEKNGIWVISDLHLGEDEDLRIGYPNRPTVEQIIKNVNQKVGKNGTLIVCGDAGLPEYVAKLKGYKVLIAGNHEPGMSNFKSVFNEIYSGMLFIHPHILLSHEPVDFPYAYNIHGHNHAGPATTYGHTNVCADVVGYFPISLDQLVKSGKLTECKDIHRITIDKATERAKKRKGKIIRKDII